MIYNTQFNIYYIFLHTGASYVSIVNKIESNIFYYTVAFIYFRIRVFHLHPNSSFQYSVITLFNLLFSRLTLGNKLKLKED